MAQLLDLKYLGLVKESWYGQEGWKKTNLGLQVYSSLFKQDHTQSVHT